MNILIIGSGGREHALAWKCAQDQNVNQVFVAPGNGGTSLDQGIENLKIDIKNADSIANICNQNGIDLVIIGPEQPLVDGHQPRVVQDQLSQGQFRFDYICLQSSQHF